MSLQPGPDRLYTYADLDQFPSEQRWELIDGVAYAMASPQVIHQILSVRLTLALGTFLRGGPCQLLVAPMDVKLSERDVVQPDLLVVCRPEQFKRSYVEGPPRLVIEILSQGSLRHDRLRKLNLYAQAGVEEYWLVTPHPALVEVLCNQQGRFLVAGTFSDKHILTSPGFENLSLELDEIFMDLPGLPPIDEVRETTPEFVVGSPAT